MYLKITKETENDRMFYGKIIIIMAFTVTVFGCTGTSKKEGLYGHWIYRGSSTFKQVFQCVDKFEPHQNHECE
jgi:hypothetical protein